MSISSSTSSSSIPSFYSNGGVTRMNGSELASGLDTQSLITALTANTQAKIDKQGQFKQIAQWKQQMYQNVENMLQSFSDSYFSYATDSTNNIMSPSFFDSGTLTSSNSSIATATGESTDAENFVIDSITSLASAATLASKKAATDSTITSGALRDSWKTSTVEGNSLVINYGGKDYTLTLDSSASLDDAATSAANLQTIADSLNRQIQSNSSLNGNMGFTVNGGKLQLNMTSSTDSATIKAYQPNKNDNTGVTFLNNLGFTSGTSTANGVTVGTSDVNLNAFFSTASTDLGTALDGSTLTFQLNGISKTITFNDSDKSQYSTVSGVQQYIQTALKTVYGDGTVNVTLNANNQLQFKTADSTSTFAVTSSSASGVLGKNGALRIESGAENCLDTTKTLKDLSGTLNLTPGSEKDGVGYYSLNVNGKTFTFDEYTELDTVMNTINNDSTAGVKISYSQTTNEFRITADDTGSQGSISISDTTDNLLSALGLDSGNTTFTAGTDLKMSITLNGSNTPTSITRSTNSTTLDGISLTINSTYNTDGASSPIKFTSSNNVDDLYKKISDFVDAYNKIISQANTYVTQEPYGLNSAAGTNDRYDPLTDAQEKTMTADEIKAWNDKAQQGLLENDSNLSSLVTNLGNAMQNAVKSVGLSLSDIGISIDTTDDDLADNGKLVIDKTKLQTMLQSEPDRVSQLFTNSDGISSQVKDVINDNIGAYGNSGALVDLAGSSTLIGVDNSQLGLQISNYNTIISDLKTQLSTEQDRWQTKFTTMETLLSTLTSQSNYLSSMSGSGS